MFDVFEFPVNVLVGETCNITSSPSATSSVPPLVKQFWTSMTSRADLSPVTMTTLHATMLTKVAKSCISGDQSKAITNELVGVLDHDSAWANEMTFVMKHAPGAVSLARPADKKSRALPLTGIRMLHSTAFIDMVNIRTNF